MDNRLDEEPAMTNVKRKTNIPAPTMYTRVVSEPKIRTRVEDATDVFEPLFSDVTPPAEIEPLSKATPTSKILPSWTTDRKPLHVRSLELRIQRELWKQRYQNLQEKKQEWKESISELKAKKKTNLIPTTRRGRHASLAARRMLQKRRAREIEENRKVWTERLSELQVRKTAWKKGFEEQTKRIAERQKEEERLKTEELIAEVDKAEAIAENKIRMERRSRRKEQESEGRDEVIRKTTVTCAENRLTQLGLTLKTVDFHSEIDDMKSDLDKVKCEMTSIKRKFRDDFEELLKDVEEMRLCLRVEEGVESESKQILQEVLSQSYDEDSYAVVSRSEENLCQEDMHSYVVEQRADETLSFEESRDDVDTRAMETTTPLRTAPPPLSMEVSDVTRSVSTTESESALSLDSLDSELNKIMECPSTELNKRYPATPTPSVKELSVKELRGQMAEWKIYLA